MWSARSSGSAAHVVSMEETQSNPGAVAHSVRTLHEASGLTWDQFARLLGVSVRTAHSWVSGLPMSTASMEALARLQNLVDTLPGTTPAERRSNLLAPSETGQSPFDHLRSENYSAYGLDINPTFPIDVLLGGVR